MDFLDSRWKQGNKFLYLALFAFAGLGLEVLLAVLIEPFIYNKNLGDFSTIEMISHWIITCVLWAVSAYVLVKISVKKYNFNIFNIKGDIRSINVLICIILLSISVFISIIDWNGFKVLKEFQYNGWLKFIFQYIYYVFETVLVLLIIVFGQKAGEIWFNNGKLPWGGILAGLTWGLVHMFTKGDLMVGLISCFSSLLFGLTYLLVKKNVYIAYPLIFLMFVL